LRSSEFGERLQTALDALSIAHLPRQVETLGQQCVGLRVLSSMHGEHPEPEKSPGG
jgi:hypothetical protein